MDTVNIAALNRFRTAKTYKDLFNAINKTKKVFVPKRKCPGSYDYGIAAYEDNVALITIDRNPLEGFDMDYIIFDAYDSHQFFNVKLSALAKKYKLKGIDLKVEDKRFIRLNIDSEYKLVIPNVYDI